MRTKVASGSGVRGAAQRPRAVNRESARKTLARSLGGPILVAFDERHPAAGALHVAEALARRDRVNAHLLGVERPLAFPAALLAADLDTVEEARRRQLLRRVRRALQKAHGVAAYWSTDAAHGAPAAVITRVAHERGSALVVIGMPPIGAPDRTAAEDAMLQIVWTAPVPVLAVPPTMERLPRRALVAVDFSAASHRAATTALTVLGASATITLAHVHPAIDFAALGRPGWDAIYARGRDALLQELGAELGQAKGITVETALLRGESAPALLDFAAAGAYDLIVAGTQGVAALDQHALGSTSTALLRGAACAVLIAPTPEVVA